MNVDPEAEKIVACWYLRDKQESILASTVQPHNFRALPRLATMWRHARDMSDAGREWLPMDFDRDGYLDQVLAGVNPIRSMVPIAERRVTQLSAMAEFRENMHRLVESTGLDAREISAEARRIVGELESSGPVRAETFADVARRLGDKFIRAMVEPEEIPAQTIPLPTPLLHDHLGGWRRGKLHLVGAITSQHKTTFSRKSLEVAAKNGHECLYWTAEDSNDDIGGRTLAANVKHLTVAHIDTLDLEGLGEQQRAEIQRGLMRIPDADWSRRIRMVDVANPTLSQVVGIIRQQAAKRLDFVVFDFLQRITPTDSRISEHAHWDRCTAELRELAKVLDIAIVCPVQPTQEGTKRVEEGKPLRRSDLRGGSAICQNAFGVLTLYLDVSKDGRMLDVHVRKWKSADIGAGKHRLWVSGKSDDLGDAER